MPNSTFIFASVSIYGIGCEGSTALDTRWRTLVKAVVWQLLGFATMTLTGWIFTGSAAQGGAIAVTGAFCGFVVYFIYERVWSRVCWGQIHAHGDSHGSVLKERLATPSLLPEAGGHNVAESRIRRIHIPKHSSR